MDEPVYKLCKRGHVRSPENLNKNRTCKLCMNLISRDPARRKQIMEWGKTAKGKEYRKKSKVKYKQTVGHKTYRARYDQKPQRKEYRKNLVVELAGSYVASLLSIPVAAAPPELIELKRNQLLFKRELKQLKQAIKGD